MNHRTVRHSRPTRALTLIEVMVALAIVSIVAAVLVVGTAGMRNTARSVRSKAQLGAIEAGLEAYRSATGAPYTPSRTDHPDMPDIAMSPLPHVYMGEQMSPMIQLDPPTPDATPPVPCDPGDEPSGCWLANNNVDDVLAVPKARLSKESLFAVVMVSWVVIKSPFPSYVGIGGQRSVDTPTGKSPRAGLYVLFGIVGNPIHAYAQGE